LNLESKADIGVTHRNWPHAPPHLFLPGETYLITCGTYKKVHCLKSPQHLSLVRNALFEHSLQFGWRLDACAILINLSTL